MSHPSPHLVHDIPYKNAHGDIQVVVEIPAGTLDKWQVDWTSGHLFHEQQDHRPRQIDFLPYPMNYGLIPQTFCDPQTGGDGDPLDMVLLAPSLPRGWHGAVRVIGAFCLHERGADDAKILALLPDGPFHGISSIMQLQAQYPGALDILRLWFSHYKGPCTFEDRGDADPTAAHALIEQAHQQWRQQQGLPVTGPTP